MTNFNSAALNENQVEKTQFSVLSVQKSVDGFDGQLSYFTRYNELRFTPDPIGDLLINGIASDVGRISYTNGIAGDGSYKLNESHTLRAGFSVSGEQASVSNTSLVERCTNATAPITWNRPSASPTTSPNLGWLAGVYVQDEWKVTNQFTINAGLRFDQMEQFVSANQFSPRLSFTYKPFENTTFHAGYARYFTPPVLVEAAPVNTALFNNTTGAVPGQSDPVLPERSHYFDAGVDQKFKFGCGSDRKSCSTLELGVDAYYKIATDLIDNGQFRPSPGAERLQLRPRLQRRHRIQGKVHQRQLPGLWQRRRCPATSERPGIEPVSVRQHHAACDLRRLDRAAVPSDSLRLYRSQPVRHRFGRRALSFCGRPATAAEAFGDDGLSWCGVKLSADMIYGSGLRDGDANIGSVPSYTQVNIGIKREFLLPNDPKPMTIRFDVVNLFDTIYEIRDGSGIGVFAPQFGPRRGFFLGISKKI